MRSLLAMTSVLVAVGLLAISVVASRPVDLTFEVVSRHPHDSTAFTQGLLLHPDGRLYESTGLYGRSTLREVDPSDGRVIRSASLPDRFFGEGLALVGDRLIQLTWREGLAFVYDRSTFDEIDAHFYQGEGWGLCFDGGRLVMSDGSDRLTFRDPDTFAAIGEVAVALDGTPVTLLNELECVDGRVWANVWMTDRIVRIDAATGAVDGVLDLDGIIDPHPADRRSGSVLNGIAWDATRETFLVTGKRWPEIIEIRVVPDPSG